MNLSDIVTLIKNGSSLRQVCNEYNLNYRKIYKIIKIEYSDIISRANNGKSKNSLKYFVNKRKMTDEKDILCKEMYESGKYMSEIAKYFNVSDTTILKSLRRTNAKIRNNSENFKKIMNDPIRREYMRKISTENYLKRRKFGTKDEYKFSEWLKKENIRFVEQYRKVGNKHPYDFFLLDHNLIVEIDGFYWHSKPEQKIKDSKHNFDAIQKGYNIIRICTKELKENNGDYSKWIYPNLLMKN